jgi:hypothetical protein
MKLQLMLKPEDNSLLIEPTALEVIYSAEYIAGETVIFTPILLTTH